MDNHEQHNMDNFSIKNNKCAFSVLYSVMVCAFGKMKPGKLCSDNVKHGVIKLTSFIGKQILSNIICSQTIHCVSMAIKGNASRDNPIKVLK